MDDMTNAVSPEMDTVEQTTGAPASVEQTPETDAVESSEEKSNTDVSESVEDTKTVPYSRFNEVYNRMKAAEEKAALVDQMKTNPQVAQQYLGTPSQDEVSLQAKQALEKLGYVDKDTVQSLVREAINEDRVYRELDSKVQELSKTWDGSNGKPKFDVNEVVEYGQKTGVYDPEAAFELMHAKQLAEYYAKQARVNVKTERQGKPVQNVGQDYDALKNEAIKSGDFSAILRAKLSR